ncbi:MAG TPA: hypothetical protein VHY30_09705 [Verrucomicrobiae bacterium]|jgi:hypothetical protein|nr:hypothetical protein [Verrucomicrobiae bacterium]
MSLFRSKRNKETERFYLLPGQGGAAYRRKQKFILAWAIIVGVAVASTLGALMYFLNRPKL